MGVLGQKAHNRGTTRGKGRILRVNDNEEEDQGKSDRKMVGREGWGGSGIQFKNLTVIKIVFKNSYLKHTLLSLLFLLLFFSNENGVNH